MNPFEAISVLNNIAVIMGILFAIYFGWRYLHFRRGDDLQVPDGPRTGGYIVLNLPDKLKPLFHDLLIGFEDYARLRGYTITFSIDNSVIDKIGFKFTVTRSDVPISVDKVRDDLDNYIKKVQEDKPLDDLPTIIPAHEHKHLLRIMKDRINFLHHRYKWQEEMLKDYRFALRRIAGGVAILPAQNFYLQGGGTMSNDNYSAINSRQITQGQCNTISDSPIDQSIKIADSFKERKEQIDSLSSLLDMLSVDTTLGKTDKEELIKNFRKVKEELSDEDKPSASRIQKWLTKAKSVLQSVDTGKEIIDQARQVIESFNISS